jgi:hypothetical protein
MGKYKFNRKDVDNLFNSLWDDADGIGFNEFEDLISGLLSSNALEKINTLVNNMPYTYKVFLTQSGTTAPVVTTLVDTIGNTTWTRVTGGTYNLTKTGAFVENKTVPISDTYVDIDGNVYTIERIDANTMTLKTYASTDLVNPADGVLTNQYLNIDIYK